jgi:hypothetical protein
MPYSLTHIIYSFNEECPPQRLPRKFGCLCVPSCDYALLLMESRFKHWVDKRQIQLLNKYVGK